MKVLNESLKRFNGLVYPNQVMAELTLDRWWQMDILNMNHRSNVVTSNMMKSHHQIDEQTHCFDMMCSKHECQLTGNIISKKPDNWNPKRNIQNYIKSAIPTTQIEARWLSRLRVTSIYSCYCKFAVNQVLLVPPPIIFSKHLNDVRIVYFSVYWMG